MRQIGVLQARTDFSAIVAEVERTGEPVTVTRHGRPAVRIVPAAHSADAILSRQATAQRMLSRLAASEASSGRSAAEVEAEMHDLLDRDRLDRWS